MSKKIYPEELLTLLEEYLADGIITDKERNVLLKKAAKLGVDTDEFDLYIDAQQQKADQFVEEAASKKRGASCPFCGAPVPQLTDKCPHCGQFITAQASKELQEILDCLEDALVDFKSGRNIEKSKAIVERFARKARLYYNNNPRIKSLLEEIDSEIVSISAEARKKYWLEKTVKNKWFWVLFILAISILLNIIFMATKNYVIGYVSGALLSVAGYTAIGIWLYNKFKN